MIVALLNALDRSGVNSSSQMFHALNQELSEPQQEFEEHQVPFEDRINFGSTLIAHFSNLMNGCSIMLLPNWNRMGSRPKTSGVEGKSNVRVRIFNPSKALLRRRKRRMPKRDMMRTICVPTTQRTDGMSNGSKTTVALP